jgi:2,4-dienoyl-CoA reductase-like NADH-dependent reductase (Old Yellow Enzyme family)
LILIFKRPIEVKLLELITIGRSNIEQQNSDGSHEGLHPVAPSAIAIEGQKHFTSQGLREYEVPRALETEEVKAIVWTILRPPGKAEVSWL